MARHLSSPTPSHFGDDIITTTIINRTKFDRIPSTNIDTVVAGAAKEERNVVVLGGSGSAAVAGCTDEEGSSPSVVAVKSIPMAPEEVRTQRSVDKQMIDNKGSPNKTVDDGAHGRNSLASKNAMATSVTPPPLPRGRTYSTAGSSSESSPNPSISLLITPPHGIGSSSLKHVITSAPTLHARPGSADPNIIAYSEQSNVRNKAGSGVGSGSGQTTTPRETMQKEDATASNQKTSGSGTGSSASTSTSTGTVLVTRSQALDVLGEVPEGERYVPDEFRCPVTDMGVIRGTTGTSSSIETNSTSTSVMKRTESRA
eukprot:gene47218-63261_t